MLRTSPALVGLQVLIRSVYGSQRQKMTYLTAVFVRTAVEAVEQVEKAAGPEVTADQWWSQA